MDIDATPKTMRADPPPPATPAPLADVVWLLTSVLERLAAVERRCGAAWVPHEETGMRLQRLVRGVAASNGIELPELVRRLTALEAAASAGGVQAGHAPLAARLARLERLLAPETAAPGPATEQQPQTSHRQPAAAARAQADRGRLRREIERILEASPDATSAAVMAALRASGSSHRPSARTVRWHLAALRGAHQPEAARGNGHDAQVRQ